MKDFSPSSNPTILSYSRALLSAAKHRKTTYGRLEILAAILSLGASFASWAPIGAIVAVLSVTAKVCSKLTLSSAKTLFRSGERARRYDFYARTLGWPVPSHARADLVLMTAARGIEESAAKLAAKESDYYAHDGAPSTERLLHNLTESLFWTERLMGFMASVRWKHAAFACVAMVAALVGTAVVQPGEGAFIVLKLIGTAVTMLVAVDVLGEAQSFARGDREIGNLLRAVEAELRKSEPSRDEGLRLLTEYNCILADLPLLPDSIYEAKKPLLAAAWQEFASTLPVQTTVA